MHQRRVEADDWYLGRLMFKGHHRKRPTGPKAYIPLEGFWPGMRSGCFLLRELSRRVRLKREMAGKRGLKQLWRSNTEASYLSSLVSLHY